MRAAAAAALALSAAGAGAGPSPANGGGGGGGARVPPDEALPLRTRGRHVVDAAGKPLRLACVNWYGSHLKQMVPTGLDVRPLADIAATTAELGFNCVRLPFSLDMIFENRTQVPEPSRWLAANPGLRESSPLGVFDAAVAALTSAGLLVILNNHISESGWCCGFRDAEGLWYTEKYPEERWLDGLGFLAARYRSNPRVVGFDLRNELHPSQSAVPTWGSGDPKTDWAMAAEKGGRRVVAENENMLVVVSGMLYCMFLCDVPRRPVHLSPALRGRTVYTAHEYGMTNIHLQVHGMLAKALPYLAAGHGCLWLLLLAAAGLPSSRAAGARAVGGPGAGCDGAEEEEMRPPRPRCSARMSLCLEVLALALPFLALAAVAAPFVQYVPPCGFAQELPTLLAILAAALLSLLSLLLWLSAAVHRLGRRCAPAAAAPRAGGAVSPEEGRQMLEVPIWGAAALAEEMTARTARAGEAADGSGRAEARARAHRGGCGWRPRCSRLLLASLVTAGALAALLRVWVSFDSYGAFAWELDRRWGFLVQAREGDEKASAPVWVGEFGEKRESLWWEFFTRYLRERQEVGWAYWSLNGDPRHPWMAVLLEDSKTVRHAWKLQALRGLMASPAS